MAKRGPYRKRKPKKATQTVQIDRKTWIEVDASFDPDEAREHFIKRREESNPGGRRSLQLKTKKT